MFGFSSAVSKLDNLNRRALSFLLLAGTLSLGAALSLPAHAQGRLNIQQLGDALTSYGKNTVSNNGQTYYTVNFGKGSWHSNVVISLSPNGTVIWMTVDPTPLPTGSVSAAALAALLKKNEEIGPMFFSINGNRLRLSCPVPNNDMNTAKVKAYVEAVVNEVFATHDLWDSKTLGGY